MAKEGEQQTRDGAQAGPETMSAPTPSALTLVQICGAGAILDVACGQSRMVLELLRLGIDAWGCDAGAATVEALNARAPGRFRSGTPLALPFPDDHVDTVFATGCLEALEPGALQTALREMARVARRTLLLRLAVTGPGGRSRASWEEAAFEAGLRRHPALLRLVPFDQMVLEGATCTLLLEKIPAAALAEHPMAKLKAERDLHMDMLRETGRRSDAHLYRYELAAQWVRPGDRVLDAACGLGYGSHLLASLTQASRVIGVDLSASAVEYGTAMFASGDGRVSFRPGDAQDLSWLPDHSFDLVVSFETLEHLPEPGAFLAEIKRVLRPGGRIITSVPNRWDDGTGHDPSPYHFHVYDWSRLARELGRHFLLEQGYGQTAGGGMRLNASEPEAFLFDPETGPARDSEWLLAVGMADPMAAEGIPYVEGMYAKAEQPGPIIAFEGDYRNPFLPHALVTIMWRLSRPSLLQELAEQVEARFGPETADHGAALCVQVYRLLEGWPDAKALRQLRRRIHAYASQAPSSPHQFRWQISLSYAAGLAALRMGDRTAALEDFQRCAAFDCRAFSPTLITKTASAAYQAGRLLVSMGRSEEAKTHLNLGIQRFFEMFEGGRAAMLGTAPRPFDAPYSEITEAAAALTSCVNLLRNLDGQGVPTPLLPVENLPGVVKRLEQDRDGWRHTAIEAQRFLDGVLPRSVSDIAARLAMAFARTMASSRPTVIFCCGPLGRDLAKLLLAEQVKVLCFCDNNETHWGETIGGLMVRDPATVLAPDFQGQIVIASGFHAPAIEADLLQRFPWLRKDQCLGPAGTGFTPERP